MKIPYSWLTELLPELPVKLNSDPRNLEPIMAMLGTGIEEIVEAKAPVDGVIFGVVLECDAIPETHLLALKVDVGDGLPKSIVTGASNARVGIGVAVATPGTVIQGVTLGVRTVQGVESWGMACSPKELELGEYGGGILELPASDAKPGTPLSSLWPADFVLDIEITPNRADALSVLGIARDLAAKLEIEMIEPSRGEQSKADANFPVKLGLDAKRDASRFVARMAKGVTTGPSPAWLQRRVTLAGMRAINNLVDASNYVMLELGQPTAAYDLRDLPNMDLLIRDANPGEKVVGLNDLEYECDPRDLLVTTTVNGASVPVGIGGMLGAKYSSIRADTTDVVIEAATWDAVRLRLTGRKHDLKTDALYRFERGVDPNLGVWAADRYMEIVKLTGGGEIVAGHGVIGEEKAREIVKFRPAYCNDFLGTNYKASDMKAALERLGFEIEIEIPKPGSFVSGPIPQPEKTNERVYWSKNVFATYPTFLETMNSDEQAMLEEFQAEGELMHSTWTVHAPTARVNMDLEEDVIEEVARVLGYEAIPDTLVNVRINDATRSASQPYDRTREVKNALVGMGFHEIVSYTFTNPDECKLARIPEPVLELRNAQSAERTHLRPAMIASLLNAARTNRQAGDVMLFEVGRVFPFVDLEEERLGVLLMNDVAPKTWQPGVAGGFYAFKGLLETMAAKLGAQLQVVPIETHVPEKPACLHPGICGALEYNGAFIGIVGAVHPAVTAALELPANTLLAEIRLPLPTHTWKFSDPSRQPAALRDLAIIAPKNIPYSRLLALTQNAAGEFLERVDPFDVFAGGQIAEGSRSVAMRLTFRAQNRTLTDEEVNTVFQNVIAAVKHDGLEVRDR
jgi:phenylalanyl-tRNA synthetase beta chain